MPSSTRDRAFPYPARVPPPPPQQPPPQLSSQLPPQPAIAAPQLAYRWRDIGYRGASEWMASEDDFFIIRRFAALNTRVLLAKQAEISRLEQQLDEMDDPALMIDNSTFLGDMHPQRRALIERLWKELKEYNDFVKAYSDLKARPPATKHELLNVGGWVLDNEGAICAEESTFIAKENHHDLMPVTPKVETPFRRWMSLRKRFLAIWPFKKEPSPYLKHVDSDGSVYFSDKLTDGFVYGVTVVLAMVMLIGPLWWLNFVNDNTKRLYIITFFVFVFSITVGAVTGARTFETVAATAGYAAVLMVFMQIGNNSSALSTQDLAKAIATAIIQSQRNLTSRSSITPLPSEIAKGFTF
ncbi:hypothetical protein GP486_007381 [Trichoglossum hirsutum]|uniref:DUF6594 domain-containing protein n=1 Tax=Trichoglossum hirsutum TaxID=265104 RepID=A0A9P8IFW2_9PEZI|nr:hypothetical protein GP486_007381 [Trichoglossum hirsutum]